jgi:pyruvate carboxylase
VDACEAAGIAFIGPKAETMRALGDKASARQVAIEGRRAGDPGHRVLGDDMEAIAKEADEIGYPLMLKASWGGGGRGMRPINGPDELEEKVLEGRREAEAAFGNGEGYLEKMILRARHVEVQILGDSTGNIYHLYERDCSVQRRNQKVVERAPAPYLSDAQREEICDAGQEDLRARELPMRRHGRVPDGYGHRRLLLHRGEPPRAGRAHRDRGGHRHRHRAAQILIAEGKS